jgi:hypothetical protein
LKGAFITRIDEVEDRKHEFLKHLMIMLLKKQGF